MSFETYTKMKWFSFKGSALLSFNVQLSATYFKLKRAIQSLQPSHLALNIKWNDRKPLTIIKLNKKRQIVRKLHFQYLLFCCAAWKMIAAREVSTQALEISNNSCHALEHQAFQITFEFNILQSVNPISKNL